MLYLLIVYSSNNQLRFNKKGEFNLPVGKRDFNAKMQKKLEGFLDRVKSGDYSFTNGDFRNVKPDEFTDKNNSSGTPKEWYENNIFRETSGYGKGENQYF